MQKRQNAYFFSDLHLGYPDENQTRVREKKIIQVLDNIKADTHSLWFLGDIFDFWWEYKKVVPRGFVRFLGKIAEFTDAGISVHFFTGNHDVWMKKYLAQEIGVEIHTAPVDCNIHDKTFHLAHGDGLGPGDINYKLLKKVFTNKFLQWCFARLHPNFAFFLAHSWSHGRRNKNPVPAFYGRRQEQLILYAEQKLKTEHYDYFVFGHRHIPMHIDLSNNTKLVNTGEWISQNTYARFNGSKMTLMHYKNGLSEKYSYPKPEENPYFLSKIS